MSSNPNSPLFSHSPIASAQYLAFSGTRRQQVYVCEADFMTAFGEAPQLPAGYHFTGEYHGSCLGRTITASREGCTDTFVVKIVDRQRFGANLPELLDTIERSKRARSKFIVPYGDVIQTDQFVFLIRPFLNYPTLAEHLSVETRTDLNYYFVVWKVLLRILQALHKENVTPLFLRPCNIFLNRENEPILTDIYPPLFDVCRKHQNPMSVCFLAPEFFKGEPRPGPPSDIWSVAVIFLFMMTRQIPWDYQNLFKMIHQITQGYKGIVIKVPDEIKEIVVNALAVDMEKRASLAWLAEQNPQVSVIQNDVHPERKLKPQQSTVMRGVFESPRLKTRQSMAQLPRLKAPFNDGEFDAFHV